MCVLMSGRAVVQSAPLFVWDNAVTNINRKMKCRHVKRVDKITYVVSAVRLAKTVINFIAWIAVSVVVKNMNIKLGSELKESLFNEICDELDALYEQDVAALRETQFFMQHHYIKDNVSFCPTCVIPYRLTENLPIRCSSCGIMLQCMRPHCKDITSSLIQNCKMIGCYNMLCKKCEQCAECRHNKK